MAISPQLTRSATEAFDRVLALIDESRAVAGLPAEAREDARAQSLALLEASGEAPDAVTLAATAYAAELLAAVAVDLAAHPAQTAALIEQLRTDSAIPRVPLGRELLRAARVLELSVELAIEVQLSLLLAFTGAGAVSLWTADAEGRPRPVAHAGHLDPADPGGVGAARAVLGAERAQAVWVQDIIGRRVDALRPPAAALLAHGADPAAPEHAPLLTAAAPTLAALLDRRALLAREQTQETVTGAVQRRLARLRYDLHDGPQQDVHLLAQDLRLFRDQLRPMIAGDPDHDRALGRLDDLEAQLVALDGDLRRLSTSVQSPFLTPGSLRDALAQLARAFHERTGIEPQTRVAGELEQLSESQQIALLALIREALSNVRKHSDAATVTIEIDSAPRGVEVQVTDDGSGFDPEATLVRAARAGHLGLVGMHERVRMLGGRTQIESRPGGPTVISAVLPPWPEALPDAPGEGELEA